ncbi:MAG: nucleoside recognition domain-containing protein [Methyloligellaceae bacterium]
MKTYLPALISRTWLTYWDLIKVMVPVMVLVKIAKDLGAIDYISPILQPVMQVMGLPAEAGIVWAATMLTNIYGGFGALPVLAGLEMSVAQVSILCTAMLFAHSLPVEQAVVKKAGASFWFTTSLRIGAAVFYGVVVSWICHLTGFLSEAADVASFKQFAQESTTYLDWLQSSAISLFTILVVIFVLYIFLDVLEKTGITKILLKLMAPLLNFSGLNEQTTPITTVGVLLGLSYGSGLIIQAVREGNIERRAIFLSLCWLCMSHALIEDTALMLALGGNIWIVLVGRVVLTILVVRLLALVLYSPAWERRMVARGKG